MARELTMAVGMMLVCVVGSIAQTASGESSGLTVEQIVICTGVTGREPVGAGETFPRTIGRLSCFTKLVGIKDTTTIQHKWYHGEELRGTISLPVKPPTWRTYSSKMIAEVWTGAWRVDVVEAATGNVLATAKFTIE